MSRGGRKSSGNASANFMSDEEGKGAANIRGDTSRRSRNNQKSARSNRANSKEIRKKINIDVRRSSPAEGEDADEDKVAIFYRKKR